MAAKLEFHPVSNLFPLMDDGQLGELAADIKLHGLQEPGLLIDGKLGDGRNRMRACEIAGVPFRTEKAKLNGMTPAQFVISRNLHRRHLTLEQRAFVAVDLKKLFEAEAAERQKAGRQIDLTAPGPEGGESRDKAGAALDVSGKTVDRAEKVQEQGSAALLNAVKAGDVPLATAAKLADLPKLDQTLAVKAGKAGIKAALADAKPKPAPKPKAGQQTNDPRALGSLEDQIAKCIRMTDDAHKKFPNAKQRDAVLAGFSASLKALKEWRKK